MLILIEKLMENQLRDFWPKMKTPSNTVLIWSFITALLNITVDILRPNDNGKSAGLILLDFNKPFDTVDHNMLPTTLNLVEYLVIA